MGVGNMPPTLSILNEVNSCSSETSSSVLKLCDEPEGVLRALIRRSRQSFKRKVSSIALVNNGRVQVYYTMVPNEVNVDKIRLHPMRTAATPCGTSKLIRHQIHSAIFARHLILLIIDDNVQSQLVDVPRPSETAVYHTTCIPVCKFVFSFTWHLPGVGYHM